MKNISNCQNNVDKSILNLVNNLEKKVQSIFTTINEIEQSQISNETKSNRKTHFSNNNILKSSQTTPEMS